MLKNYELFLHLESRNVKFLSLSSPIVVVKWECSRILIFSFNVLKYYVMDYLNDLGHIIRLFTVVFSL